MLIHQRTRDQRRRSTNHGGQFGTLHIMSRCCYPGEVSQAVGWDRPLPAVGLCHCPLPCPVPRTARYPRFSAGSAQVLERLLGMYRLILVSWRLGESARLHRSIGEGADFDRACEDSWIGRICRRTAADAARRGEPMADAATSEERARDIIRVPKCSQANSANCS